MTTGQRIKRMLSATGKTQAALAEYCGVSAPAVSGWIAGRGVSDANAIKAAEFFEVDPAWLLDGAGPEPDVLFKTRFESRGVVREYIPKEMNPPPGYSAVGEYQLMFKAGAGCEPEWEAIEAPDNVIWLRDDFFYRNHTTPDHCKAIRVYGDSMEPALASGDRVVCSIPPASEVSCNAIHDGHIYALLIDNVLRIKRLSRIQNGYRITSDNPMYPPEDYVKEDANRIHIFGRALYVEREL